MLNIYIYKKDIPEDYRVIVNVENRAFGMKFTGEAVEKKLVAVIEEGEIIDAFTFRDRHGNYLKNDYLSTGTKAGLCVLNSTEKEVIDLIECGCNAIGAIVSCITEGNILLRHYSLGIPDYTSDGKIDVCLGKYRFTELERLNYYFRYEHGITDIDLENGGVELVQ